MMTSKTRFVLFALCACGGSQQRVEAPSAPAQAAQRVPDNARSAAVSIRFKPVVDGVPFRCGVTYHHVGTTHTHLTPVDFRFFVQDLKLITSEGNEVPVVMDVRPPWQIEEVALLDFENAQGRCAADAEMNDVVTGVVPAGEYTGVVFSNGVPEALNHADPATLPAPLTAGGAHWGWLAGFRFFLGSMTAVSGSGGALLHTGATSCTVDAAGAYTCGKPNRNVVRLTGFNPANNVIVADLGAAFSRLDLSASKQCHGEGPTCSTMFDALGINYASGASSETQSVYSVE